MKITKLERAKKQQPVYHIYSNDTLLLSVTEETLIRFQLNKGMELSEEILDEIHRYDQIQRCTLQAIRYLSRRGHFEQELEQKLHQKGYDSQIIQRTLENLRHKKYLDDTNLMKQFVHDGIHLRKYGPLLLKQKLIAKGIHAADAEAFLARVYKENLQTEIAQKLAGKKWRSYGKNTPLAKRKQKVAAFLQQRGFTWNIIRPLLAALSTDEPEDE